MEPVKTGLFKRKKMTAHTWKSRFKRLRAQEVETELEGSDRSSHVCNNNSINIATAPVAKTAHIDDLPISGVVGILRDKSVARISDGPFEKLTSSLRGCGLTAVENEGNIDSNLKENVLVKPPGGDGLENLRINSASKEILDDRERLPTSGPLLRNKNSSGPESMTCLGGFQDDPLNSKHHENETLSAKSENCGLVETRITSSKEKRMSCSAHEKELSSCDATAEMEMDDSSSSKKLTSKGEGSEGEISNEIMKIQKLCKKRMKKLKLEQQRDLQDWEEEKLRLQNHHKLETAIIRCVFSEGSTGAGKLKLVGSEFKKKMEELNTQLKDIKLKHESAIRVERCKAAQWLAAAKAFCSSEQKAAVCGAQSFVSNMGVPLDVPEIVDNIDTLELSNGPNKQDANVLADGLANQGGDIDEPISVDSPVARQVSETKEQRETLPNHCGSLTLKVSEDQAHLNLVSANPQENSACPLDGQSTLQIEDVNCELDSIGTNVQSHIEKQRIENCEQQCFVPPIHASPTSDLSPGTGVDCPTCDSGSPTAEAVETLVLSPEPLMCANPKDGTEHHMQPHIEEHRFENCEQQHLVSTDASSSCNPSQATDVEHQTHDSGRNSSWAGEAEEPFVLPLETSPQIVGNSSHWLKNPLESELQRLHKENEHFEQSGKDMILHLKSQCEMEIQEMLAQIRRKYDAKLKDAETEFGLKKNELHKNCDKVLLNKMLTDVLNINPTHYVSGFPGMQQGILLSHMQHHHQPLIQQSVRLAPGPEVLQLADVQIPSPTQGLMQQLLVPHPTTPITCRNIAAEQHAVHVSHGSSSRPPISSARNPYMVGGYRSPAPHLASAMPPVPQQPLPSLQSPPLPRSMPVPEQLTQLQLPQSSQPPPVPQPVPPPYQNQATLPNGLTAFNYPSLAAPNFVAGINLQQPMLRHGTTQNLPEISSTFGSLDPSFWETMNHVHVGNPPSSA